MMLKMANMNLKQSWFLLILTLFSVNLLFARGQTDKQRKKMQKFDTVEKIIKKAEAIAKDGIYCDGTLLAEACEEERQAALEMACITEEYLEILRNIRSGKITEGLAPVCSSSKKALIGFCKCGCFPGNTKLYTSTEDQGEFIWKSAQSLSDKKKNFKLVTIDGDFTSYEEIGSELKEVLFQSYVGKKYPQHLYHVTSDLDHQITLTANHAILLADGRLVAVKDLKIGDHLVTNQGERVKVKSIHYEKKSIVPYNVQIQPNSSNPYDHLIFAAGDPGKDGLTIGDISFQNSLHNELARQEIRK